jgi:hypothetical protein
MSEDLIKLGAPIWFAIFFVGFSIGVSGAAAVYEKGRIPGLENKIESLETREVETENRLHDWKTRAELLKTKSCDNSEMSTLRMEKDRLLKWNIDWKTAHDNLVINNSYLQARVDLTQHIKDMEAHLTRASDTVIAWVSNSCPNGSSCDLTPLSQRKLKALEQERDQLHAQVLDLQARTIK